MKRIFSAALAALGIALLTGCDKKPEHPAPPPPPISTPAPAAAPEAAAPAAVPVPENRPELVPPPRRPKAHRVVAPKEPPLPEGYVRMAAGEVTGADGQLHRTGAFGIAREPVTVGELRAWAESEGGRRLPQVGHLPDASVATDLDWLAAEAYARWLSEKEHRPYRLPTEAEWQRAAQSGRISTQAQRQPAEPPLWEWTGDCWDSGDSNGHCPSRVLVGGENAATGNWGRAAMGARRPAASFRLVLDLP